MPAPPRRSAFSASANLGSSSFLQANFPSASPMCQLPLQTKNLPVPCDTWPRQTCAISHFLRCGWLQQLERSFRHVCWLAADALVLSRALPTAAPRLLPGQSDRVVRVQDDQRKAPMARSSCRAFSRGGSPSLGKRFLEPIAGTEAILKQTSRDGCGDAMLRWRRSLRVPC